MDSLETLSDIEEWIDVNKQTHVNTLANDTEIEVEVVNVRELIRYIRGLLT